MAARAAFSPAGSEAVSPGLSPPCPDALASVPLSLSATGGRLTGGRGLGWNGTGAWRVSTEAFCTVGAGSALRVRGMAMDVAGDGAAVAALFSPPAIVTGRATSVAGRGCGHGEATPCGAVVSRLALATPAAVIIRVATRMPRFICRPDLWSSTLQKRRHLPSVARGHGVKAAS